MTLPSWLAGIALTAAMGGCAVHYTDANRGTEHLWGFGQLRLQSQPAGTGLAAVTGGFCVPGLCLEVGRDQFGLAFGYLARARLAVVGTNAVDQLEFPHSRPGFLTRGSINGLWALGHARMRGVPAPARHYAIVTGKALAGLGAHAGRDDTTLGFALSGRQQAVVLDENLRLDLDQPVPRWPGFNLFSAQVNASPPRSLEQTQSPVRP